MSSFKVIPCKPNRNRRVRVYDRDGTYTTKEVAGYEAGPQARAYAAERAQSRITPAEVAKSLGISTSEAFGIEAGRYTFDDADWPKVFVELRKIGTAKKKLDDSPDARVARNKAEHEKRVEEAKAKHAAKGTDKPEKPPKPSDDG